MGQSLVAFDTDHIKKYVFATNKLKEIRGASALLDHLNRETMITLAGGECIYANGGGGLFVVDTEQTENIIHMVGHAYRQQGASITGASIPLSEEIATQVKGADVKNELALLRHRLRRAKDGSQTPTLPLTHSLLRFCDSCGIEYAVTRFSSGELLCPTCNRKRQEDAAVKNSIEVWSTSPPAPDENRLWGRLIRLLQADGSYPITGYTRPEKFETLGDLSKPNNYMGLIYADGDNMGREIEQIQTLAEMKRFADAVDGALYQAVSEAITHYLSPDPNDSEWPFDILLLGGDDLVMVTRAESAMQVALYITKRFPVLTEERWGKPLNLSTSVVLTHVNYPIGSLLDLAESSLSFAKRTAARRTLDGNPTTGGMLNFLVVNSANHQEFDQYYNQTLKEEVGTTTFYRTQRPYTVTEMEELLAQIAQLGAVPRTKLQQLRSAVFKSKRQGTIDAMMAILRMNKQEQREALLSLVGTTPAEQLHLPWVSQGKNWITPILDIVDLIDFVGKGDDYDED